MKLSIELAERGMVPDTVIRMGIRRLLEQRRRALVQEPGLNGSGPQGDVLAVHTAEANAQHYAVPPEFFRGVLGNRMKYSCCWFEPDQPASHLDAAEAQMLARTCARAEIEDGMKILDLGCGWGAFTLWVAERFPHCTVVALSNAKEQGAHIRDEAVRRKLPNVHVLTEDINDFAPACKFDRIVSIEMIEHVRNHAALLSRVASWLKPGGRFFVHHFCHAQQSYMYDVHGDADWMAQHFFTGGTMPARDSLVKTPAPMRALQSWDVNGDHYARTCRAWLERLDANKDWLATVLRRHYGVIGPRMLQRWRIFFMACEELFAYDDGAEWFVVHHLMAPAAD